MLKIARRSVLRGLTTIGGATLAAPYVRAQSSPVRIVLAGYGPPQTSFSRGLKLIGDRLQQQFGERIALDYVLNVMDVGRRPEDLWSMVEQGEVTLAYLTSSGLADRVPDVGIADLPFLFGDLASARSAVDGRLGAFLTQRIEGGTGLRVLGYFENGFRQVSNRLRVFSKPEDMRGMRIRVLESPWHARLFECLGAEPVRSGLREAIAAMRAGTIDAQENPFANTMTYGAHTFHHFHTATNHLYLSRPIFVNRAVFKAWPADLQEGLRAAVAEAVRPQRDFAAEEEITAREAIVRQGCAIAELTSSERDAFIAAVRPVHVQARKEFGAEALRIVE